MDKKIVAKVVGQHAFVIGVIAAAATVVRDLYIISKLEK